MFLRRLLLLAVAATSAAAQPPAVVTQAPVDPRTEIGFHAMLFPREIYVGQQASYQVGVFIAQDARARLRRNPEFIPPELRSMLGYDLPSPKTFTRVAGGRTYEVHVFQRAIFPLVPGRHAIAPARLSYSLPLSTSFFSREESRTLRSESLAVIARDPPIDASRQPDFSGAVGMLSLERRVDIQRVSVGTPVVLTVAVRGVGNVALLPRPAFRLTWAQLVDGPERVQLDTTGALVRGAKEFDYILTPTAAGAQTFPALRYAYFDPYAQRYANAQLPDLAVSVEQGALVATTPSMSETEQPLTIRKRDRGVVPRPVSSSANYWFALAAIPLPAAAVAFVRRSRRRDTQRVGTALQRLAGNKKLRDGADVRRALTLALGERLQIDAATLADPRRIVRALRRRGVTRETAHKAAALHAELDAVVFSGERREPDPMLAHKAAAIFDAIDREATRRRTPLGRIAVASLFFFAVSVPLVAAIVQPSVDSDAFQRGVTLYETAAYPSAQRVFSAIASAQPRSADAWANAGASAWQAHDTAAAAVAWQRALRLDPLDSETRDRLDLIPSFRRGLFGEVPPIPLAFVAWLGLGAWLIAWGFQPVRRRWARYTSRTALVFSSAMLVSGIRLSEVAHGRQTAVVQQSERLRSSPSLGADLAEEVMLGETVRTPTARDTWTLVRLADGRQGWLPTERLVSLELRD
ncbi:MAG TPA: hypothetical protein VJ717_06940 [Gemmatimonadaceae bacterium]|nr:hypothetical protein [Gemmatimonadaceae bacterium]